MVLEFKLPGSYEVDESTMKEYADRYSWLRSDVSKSGFDKPFVMNQRKSRLYAIVSSTLMTLDLAIDYDIFVNTCNDVHLHGHMIENRLVDHLPRPLNFISDEYCDAVAEETYKLLGWSQARIDQCKEYEKTI